MLGIAKRLVGISCLPLRHFVGKLFEMRASAAALTGSRMVNGKSMSPTGLEVEVLDRITLARQEQKKKALEAVIAKAVPSSPPGIKEDFGVEDIALDIVADDAKEEDDPQVSDEARKLLSARARLLEKSEVLSRLRERVKDEEEKKDAE